jgi:hypothetical protein
MRAPLVIVLICLVSCSSFDRAIKAQVDRELARCSKATPRVEGPSGNVPAPWAQGQYAIWAIKSGEETTLVQASVDAVAPNAVTVTMTTLAPKRRTAAQLTFAHQPKDLADARASLLQIVRRRGDETPFTYRFLADTPDQMRDALEPLWGSLVPAPVPGPPQTLTTAPATLESCATADARFAYRHTEIWLDGYVHSAVPITGLVKGAAKNGKEIVEVIDYGWDGGSPTY